MTTDNTPHKSDIAPTYNSHRPHTFLNTLYLYIQPSYLGIAIWIQLIASLLYTINDITYSYHLNLYHTKVIITIMCIGAVLFFIDSIIFYIAYRQARQQHHTGHANDDMYEICTGRIDSTIGVVAYIANIIGSFGYVISSFVSAYSGSDPYSKAYSDTLTHYIDVFNMLMFVISSYIFLHIWLLDEMTCAKAKPLDQTIVSNISDTVASTVYFAIVAYGLISRLLIRHPAHINSEKSAYDYQGQTREIGTKEHKLYVLGDIIYLISPIVLLIDYYKRKHHAIHEHYDQLLEQDSDHGIENSEVTKLIKLQSQPNVYGSTDHVDAISLDVSDHQ